MYYAKKFCMVKAKQYENLNIFLQSVKLKANRNLKRIKIETNNQI